MDKSKFEKICKKIGFGTSIGLTVIFIIFFYMNSSVLGEIILYNTISDYMISSDIRDLFKNEETVPIFNDKNSIEVLDEVELVGIDDISYEHNKNDDEIQKSLAHTNNNLDLDKLADLDYLKNNFYIVDAKTALSEDYFNVNDFLSTDISIGKDMDNPKILVFHTHANEMFKDSKPNDLDEGIVGAGKKLVGLLENTYGIKTMHVTDEFDKINGRVQRNGAYERMEPTITKILEENPSIELVIDLHRDGVNENTHLVTNINGKPTAKIMFFNGISRIVEDGKLKNISNLPNPYIKTNLALSFLMNKKALDDYPNLTRKIYIKSYRYSLHLKPKTLLVEAGAQTNSKEEIHNAMEILAKLINDVIFS